MTTKEKVTLDEAKKLGIPMTEEEFKDELQRRKEEHISRIFEDLNNGILHIFNFGGVTKFKSVRRAIKRGKVDIITGIVYPRRPFNNRKPTLGRSFNESKKQIYGIIKGRKIE